MPGRRGDGTGIFNCGRGVAQKVVPADARVTIRNGRGDISVRSSDEAQIRVSGKKKAKVWNENDAQQAAGRASVEIVQNGDGYEIHPTGINKGDSRISLDLDVAGPKKAALAIRDEKGDITVAGMTRPVNAAAGVGDVEIRGTAGDVNIEARKSGIKVSDTNGNIKITRHGGETNGSWPRCVLTIQRGLYTPIRARPN